MKRSVFLQRLAGLLGLSVIAPAMPPEKTTHSLLRFHVRGFQFYEGPGLLSLMKAGEELELVREPQNPHDPQAIALHYAGKKIGFVPRERNEVICKLLDQQSLPLYARIISLEKDARPWDAVETEIGYKEAA